MVIAPAHVVQTSSGKSLTDTQSLSRKSSSMFVSSTFILDRGEHKPWQASQYRSSPQDHCSLPVSHSLKEKSKKRQDRLNPQMNIHEESFPYLISSRMQPFPAKEDASFLITYVDLCHMEAPMTKSSSLIDTCGLVPFVSDSQNSKSDTRRIVPLSEDIQPLDEDTMIPTDNKYDEHVLSRADEDASLISKPSSDLNFSEKCVPKGMVEGCHREGFENHHLSHSENPNTQDEAGNCKYIAFSYFFSNSFFTHLELFFFSITIPVFLIQNVRIERKEIRNECGKIIVCQWSFHSSREAVIHSIFCKSILRSKEIPCLKNSSSFAESKDPSEYSTDVRVQIVSSAPRTPLQGILRNHGFRRFRNVDNSDLAEDGFNDDEKDYTNSDEEFDLICTKPCTLGSFSKARDSLDVRKQR